MGSLDANCILSPRGFSPLDMDDFKRQAHETIDFICDYYKGVESQPVVPDVEPGYLRRLLPEAPSSQPVPFSKVLGEIKGAVLPGMTHWANPNFFAYFPATLSSAALCGDLLASALNPVAFNWLSSPAVTELESLTLDWLAQLIRLPSSFLFSGGGGGVLQATTSEAMLCTLVAARKMVLDRAGPAGSPDKLTVYTSDQTHSTFAKACKVAGFLPENIRILPAKMEDELSLSPGLLRSAMAADMTAGLLPTYFCATVGTTSSTAVDPVAALAEVAGEFGAWVHVDAAYAGSACVCAEFRHHLDGVEKVDSISMSPHKWLLTGLDCCCLWVQDRARLTAALSTDPEYLKNRATETGQVVDYKDWQLGVGKRFRALKLYMVMRCYGTANLQAHIRSDVRMARGFEEMVRSDERFEIVVQRRFALVCFRMRPRRAGAVGEAEADAANRRLLQEVNADGGIYATHTVIGGMYVIRFAVGTTLTSERHVKAAWELFRSKADVAWDSATR